MSRRAAAIEEEFDDDTDLPLPAFNLPNTGARGPLLQQLGDEPDPDSEEESDDRGVGPASPMRQGPFPSSDNSGRDRITDTTPYKTFVHVLCAFERGCCTLHLPSLPSWNVLLTGILDGLVSIPFTWMPSGHIAQASAVLLEERLYGGL